MTPATPARPDGAGAENDIEPWRMALIEDLVQRGAAAWAIEMGASLAKSDGDFARGYAAGAAAERERAERLEKAVRAWDASLSEYCDGPERDAVRAALDGEAGS